jgi:diadenosine tetraphosphate (Ap4A) HIT family hydrolase
VSLEWLNNRIPLDIERYLEASRARCFICALRDGEPGFDHHVIVDSPEAIAFLAKYPAVYGHVLVAPREHREAVIADFTEEEYLRLQRMVRRVGEAVESALPCERLYVLSLGSQTGNAHVHWHIVPCPPGLPYEMQQANLLLVDRDGYVDVPSEEMARVASALRSALGKNLSQ